MSLDQRLNIRIKLVIQLQNLLQLEINGHQYMVHDSNYLCNSIPSKGKKPYHLKGMSILPTTQKCVSYHSPIKREFKPKHIYELNTSNDLPDQVIPIAVDHSINHKYPILLNTPVLNTSCNRVYVQRALYTIH